MEERDQRNSEGYLDSGMDRRTFLKIAGVTGGLLAMQGLARRDLLAAEARIDVEDPAYSAFYNSRKGFYMQAPKWVEQTLRRLQWPKAGEAVPEIGVLVIATNQFWIDIMRKVSADVQQLGLKYNVQPVSNARWLEDINQHVHGDIELHPSIMRAERLDASEWLTSRAYGLDRRNYGEWVNKEFDQLIPLQSGETDAKKRLEYVQKAQEILAEDYYITQIGWGPSIIEAYNSEQWEGVVPTRGFGITSLDMFWTYLKIQPKTSRKRLVVGLTQLLETTNMFAAGHRFRAVGRMIYDRLAYLDKDLKVIPWAAESWKKVDNRTWDIKLRGGMKFHDGKPVTVDDLQFTFDFMMKYERGIFYTTNQFLEKVEIVDRENRLVRFRFKQPYGEFEMFFLVLNIIIPKHVFEGIMEKQKVGDNPRLLEIPHPIGSGPFKFGPYKKDAQLLLMANKEHFSAPKIDELLLVVVPSVDGIMGRLESQEIDLAEEIYLTTSQAKQLGKSKHVSIVRTPDIKWFHAVSRPSWLPWRDIEFRRAWHHSFDREFLVKVVWEGEGRVPTSNTFFVPGNPWHNPNLPSLPKYDLKLARQILKDAGYSWNSEGRLVYPPSTDKKFIERVTRVCKPGYHWGGLKMQPRS
jgi:peptide/nickel transport system substrate-binding protein